MRRSAFRAADTVLALLLAALLATAASAHAAAPSLSVVATTGHIGDALANVAPDLDVFVLVGPGLDPHTYEASTRDIQRLRSADLVFWNALDLEAQMDRQIRSLGARQVPLGERVPEELLLPFEGAIDPHIWNSTEIRSLVVQVIADELAARLPERADEFRANAAAYGMQALAIEGISTADEASIQDLRELADLSASERLT